MQVIKNENICLFLIELAINGSLEIANSLI